MKYRKLINIIFLIVFIFSPLMGKTVQVGATPLNPTDETKVPHYFGPWPNWANSPYTLPDVTVTISGDGVGAEATAKVGANGAVTDIVITNPGSGYTSAAFSFAGSGAGASADAVINASGVIASITVDPANQGSGYIYPYVTISGGDGTGATATAYGGVDLGDILLATPSSGYTLPTVEFDLPDDPSGTPATGHALCVEALCQAVAPETTVTVTGIQVDSAGSGYSSAPKFVVRDGTVANPINNRAATAAKEAQLQALNATTVGPFTLSQANLLALAATAMPSGQAPLHILYVVMDTFGTGYTNTNPPTVTIADSSPVPGSGALATPTIEGGAVIGFTNLVGGSGYLTPGGIKKFQDGLPMLCDPSVAGSCVPNNLGQYMPLAVPDQTTFPGADYYVIALVQHREQMNSSLPAQGTLLREYVQLETPANASWSKHVALQTDLLDGTSVPTLMPDGSQAYAVDDPHYLGPIIQTDKDKPVRLVFYNLLPTGSAGDLFIPMDSTFMGAGMGPMDMMAPMDMGSVLDEIRNPMCGEPNLTDMQRMSCFAENRATLHLHGGITPWISDGSPHQWITPANEMTGWPEGVAVRQVPDMVGQAAVDAGIPDCSAANDGCMTFYYTNQQSARLMFYHDHAWGITRLNVYAGEAAGYIIRDATEKALIDAGLIPSGAAEIPLVIQDRTFVPQDSQLYDVYDANGNLVSYGQDPTWDKTRWGSYGDLWYEHVYMPAQNPNDPSGLSSVGRWFYGPWFWPPATPEFPAIDNPYYNMDPNGPDGIRGTADDWTSPLAVPCNLDDPATWQYDTDPFCEPPQIPGTPNNSAGMEQFNDTPIVNGTAYPTTTVDPKSYRFRILNAANDRFWNLQWYVADPTQCADPADPTTCTEVALNPAELAAAQTDPNIFPTPDTSLSPAGPSWIQIGTEGGFLPAPVVVPNQPITWIIDPTRFDVGNVKDHSLLLGPAERADVIVDFSKFAGKTLILYNDAPAAFPARISTYDYYTGAPDLSPAGAPSILAGYGPNTRTIMQVNVANVPAAPAFNLTALQNAFKHHVDESGVFESGQAPIIVGQAAYNTAYATTFSSGSWCNDPAAPAGKPCDGFARISEQGYDTFKFDTLSGSQIGVRIEPKAIHDETNSTNFEPYGRMTGNLGVEVVPASPLTQNVVLYPFVNPSTEIFDGTNLPTTGNLTPISVGDDGTQIWKFTHNGVDTHPIHFHLYDVQLLNRVTWDNIIIPPDASELGWKDTVRVSPLQDTYFAIRPIIPSFPFEIPNSVRPQNPMMPLGDTTMFNNVDPNGNPSTPIVNQLVNFGWEYMIHCHILSHEEMDMMRPVTVAMPPIAPDGLAFNTGTATLSWNDNSITETSFLVQRSTDGGATWSEIGTILSPLDVPNIHQPRSLVDQTYDPYTEYQYQVVARNTVGYGAEFPSMTVQSVSAPLVVLTPPKAPSNLTATLVSGPLVNLAWVDNSNNETSFVIERATGNGAFAPIAVVGANVVTYQDTTLTYLPTATTYRYRVQAVNAQGSSPYSNIAQVTVPAAVAAPTNLTATILTGPVRVQLVFRDNATTETGFVIERSVNNGAFTTLATLGPRFNVGNVTYNDTTVSGGNTYSYRVAALSGTGMSAYSNTATVTLSVPAAPTNVTAQGIQVTNRASRVILTWTDNANNETGFVIQRASNAAFTLNVVNYNVTANSTTYMTQNLTRGVTYYFRIQAVNGFGSSAWVNATPFPVTTP